MVSMAAHAICRFGRSEIIYNVRYEQIFLLVHSRSCRIAVGEVYPGRNCLPPIGGRQQALTGVFCQHVVLFHNLIQRGYDVTAVYAVAAEDSGKLRVRNSLEVAAVLGGNTHQVGQRVE